MFEPPLSCFRREEDHFQKVDAACPHQPCSVPFLACRALLPDQGNRHHIQIRCTTIGIICLTTLFLYFKWTGSATRIKFPSWELWWIVLLLALVLDMPGASWISLAVWFYLLLPYYILVYREKDMMPVVFYQMVCIIEEIILFRHE